MITDPPSTSVAYYTVKPGDTLSGISEQYTHDPGNWIGLWEANRSVIGPDYNLIYPGQRLRLEFYLGRHQSGSVATGLTSYTGKHSGVPSGTLSCSGLEMLWDDAGGSQGEAVTAASIAMAESGGNQYATGPVGERGYWQINPASWPPDMATYNPLGNADAAVKISRDGTDWSAWTTYTSGAYAGRC